MPFAITPEHQKLVDSMRSLLARVAPSELLYKTIGYSPGKRVNTPPYWQTAAEQGASGSASGRIRWQSKFRQAIVLTEFGYWADRAVSDLQRAESRDDEEIGRAHV